VKAGGMGGGGGGRAEDESWTDMEDVQPDLVEAVPVRHGMVLAGRYAIEKIIGRGGSGVVVRAHDRDLKEVVAIKIVRAELAGQRIWAERLAREVRLARQIQHPHVCRVFDFQQADGRVFLVMELAERGTLRDELRSGAAAARPLAERIADARAVASALAAIHTAGIVHRDLTPQNLLRMGDGRLVLSDFGLATDGGESTSVHGGTVAYMAPEVMHGGKSSIASDVWALGVVMHEIVFGTKPRWSEAGAGEMLAPEIGRKLTEEERAALEACRGCTAREVGRRVTSASEAGRLLTERRGWWRPRLVVSRRGLMVASAGVVLAAAAAMVVAPRIRQSPPPVTVPSPLIVPTGEAADWTDLSTVIVEVPERIQCTRLLPDQRTVRFVWGAPPRAEDIDTVSRKRVPSPLVPAAYAEGCPDLSPDGKRLVYQGHAAGGRAFAFLSQRPDGEDAIPVVPTAEPTMSSEPTWLADGQTFSYDVDMRHMGVFSTIAGRTSVLPEVTPKPYVTTFRFVIGDLVVVSTVFETAETEFAGFAIPSMEETVRFRLPEFALDLRSVGSFLYYANPMEEGRAHLTELDISKGQARRLGHLRDQFIRYPTFLANGLAFVSTRLRATVVVRSPGGAVRGWTVYGRPFSVAHCGADLVTSTKRGDRMVVERVDPDGRLIATMTGGPSDVAPVCSPDGRILFYLQQQGRPSIMRCDRAGCRSILNRPAMSLSISPDGQHLAFVALEVRGPVVELMDLRGGQVRELMETETACQMGWTSAKTLWVSRRRDGKIIWIEVDTESGRETGQSFPGSRDCADGYPDPKSPVQPDLRMVYDQISQLRLLGKEHLARH
jgi:tRNA A-37 threonylcarbamoyl transferase component Bud32